MDKVQHFEIPADNISRAGKFYKNVFGWHVHDTDMKDMVYHMLHTVKVDNDNMPLESGAINGGLMKRKNDETPMVVITVKSIEDTMKMAMKEGGAPIMDKMPVGDMGYYARIKDSEGNLIGIWQEM